MRYIRKEDSNNKKTRNCYVILEEDNSKKLFDLLDSEIIVDISNYTEENISSLIRFFKDRDMFVGKIKREDLPVLMVILNDYDGLDYTAKDIALDFKKSKMTYNKIEEEEGVNNKIYLDYDLDYKLDTISKENYVFEDEYLHAYYKLLILKLRKIEDYYLGLDDYHKKIFLDEYEKISSIKKHKSMEDSLSHFRTASPIINTEILKKTLKDTKK